MKEIIILLGNSSPLSYTIFIIIFTVVIIFITKTMVIIILTIV